MKIPEIKRQAITEQSERIQVARLSEKAIQLPLLLIRSVKIFLGDKLPPESTLTEHLSISRGILRESLTVLEARGFVRRIPPRRHFHPPQPVGQPGRGAGH